MIKVSCFSNIGAYHPFSLRDAASLCQELEKNLRGIMLTAKFSVSQRDRESGLSARGWVELVWLRASGAACLPLPKHEFHPCSIGLFDRGHMQHSRANCSWLGSSNTNIVLFLCLQQNLVSAISTAGNLRAGYGAEMESYFVCRDWSLYIYINIYNTNFICKLGLYTGLHLTRHMSN